MAKNIYIGVDNVARKVKQPHIGVDNVARKVKNGFIGVDNVARQFFSGGTPLSALAVGTVIKLNESGVAQEYLVVNQGIPSGSSLYDSSCNGTWLLRKECIESMKWGNNNVYESSTVHTWLNSTMLSKYDAVIQSLIKQVKIPYRMNGGTNGRYAYGADGLSCKVFLLSGYEVGYTTNTHYAMPIDGARLSYFEDGTGDSANSKRSVTALSSTIYGWWLRSPDTSSTKSVYASNNAGLWVNLYCNRTDYAVRPALIMPFETLVNADMNIIAA